MKKLLKKGIIASLCIFVLAGCSSRIEKNKYSSTDGTSTKEVENIESYNIMQDLKSFKIAYFALEDEIDSLVENETVKEEIIRKSTLAHVNYMNKVNELAIARINVDIQGLYNDTESYLSYIAMLQSYSEAFLEEKDQIVNSGNIVDGEYTYKSTNLLFIIEDYYLSLLEKM